MPTPPIPDKLGKAVRQGNKDQIYPLKETAEKLEKI